MLLRLLFKDPFQLASTDEKCGLLVVDSEFDATTRVSPFLAGGDFHARSRFARSTIPEEKCMGTTRSLWSDVKWVMLIVKCRNSFTRLWFVVISDK